MAFPLSAFTPIIKASKSMQSDYRSFFARGGCILAGLVLFTSGCSNGVTLPPSAQGAIGAGAVEGTASTCIAETGYRTSILEFSARGKIDALGAIDIDSPRYIIGDVVPLDSQPANTPSPGYSDADFKIVATTVVPMEYYSGAFQLTKTDQVAAQRGCMRLSVTRNRSSLPYWVSDNTKNAELTATPGNLPTGYTLKTQRDGIVKSISIPNLDHLPATGKFELDDGRVGDFVFTNKLSADATFTLRSQITPDPNATPLPVPHCNTTVVPDPADPTAFTTCAN